MPEPKPAPDPSAAERAAEDRVAVQAAAAQAAAYPVRETAAAHAATLRAGGDRALANIVPILRIDIRPTNVSPETPVGPHNMKRVLNSVLNDEANRITAKDENGRSLGVASFKEIFPQVQGPASDGSIQVEYHDQATLGSIGDLLWSLQWFFKNGILGVPRQVAGALLQQVGVSFQLETYYRNWLASILDQLHQQGVLLGYSDSESGECRWEIYTEIAGRNIVVRPLAKYRGRLRSGEAAVPEAPAPSAPAHPDGATPA